MHLADKDTHHLRQSTQDLGTETRFKSNQSLIYNLAINGFNLRASDRWWINIYIIKASLRAQSPILMVLPP